MNGTDTIIQSMNRNEERMGSRKLSRIELALWILVALEVAKFLTW